MVEQSPGDHRRFLKQMPEVYQLGVYFPEDLALLPKSKSISFKWLRDTDYGSIVFLMSAYCSACRMEPVQEFVEHFGLFRYIVLFEGDKEKMELQQEEYDLSIPFYQCDTLKLHNQLMVSMIPYALILNKIGQVVGAGVFNDYEQLKQLADPLIRVYESKLAKI